MGNQLVSSNSDSDDSYNMVGFTDSDSDYEDDSDTELDSSQKKRTPAKYRGNAEVLDMNDMGKRKPIDRLDATFLKKERKQRGTLRQRFGLTKRNKDYNKLINH